MTTQRDMINSYEADIAPLHKEHHYATREIQNEHWEMLFLRLD